MNNRYRCFNECALETAVRIPDGFINLIMTSPPYADARKRQYGGCKPEEYVEWFLPFSKEMFRILNNTGTFILNIKENAKGGERNPYVLELILALRKQGWNWTEEFIWFKKTCSPGKWPNRFRDSWERLLQFNKEKRFDMYQEEVMIPMSESTKKRALSVSARDRLNWNNSTGSGFTRNILNFQDREFAYPTNVLHLAPAVRNKQHSAAFPESLLEFFIKCFSKKNDVVYDPFSGSQTVGVVCAKLGRYYIGSENNLDNYICGKERLEEAYKFKIGE